MSPCARRQICEGTKQLLLRACAEPLGHARSQRPQARKSPCDPAAKDIPAPPIPVYPSNSKKYDDIGAQGWKSPKSHVLGK